MAAHRFVKPLLLAATPVAAIAALVAFWNWDWFIPIVQGRASSALGRAVGRRAVSLATPRPLLRLGAAVDRLIRRDKAKLTPDRAAYFCHPDWVVSESGAPARDVWRPEIATEQGLAQTALWYRSEGWL